MNNPELTPEIHHRAPAIIKLGSTLVSASDYGDEETRNLLEMKGLKEDAINKIMASRYIAKLGYRSDEKDSVWDTEHHFEHTAGVTLLLLLELSETDPDILAAAESHNVLSRTLLSKKEMKNLISNATSPGSLTIIQIVTKTEENRDTYYDIILWNKKAAKLKVANRMYNLRCLDIFHVVDPMLTREHLEKAKEYTQETREFMLPIATEHLFQKHLLHELEKAEERVSEVDIMLTKRETEEAVSIRLML